MYNDVHFSYKIIVAEDYLVMDQFSMGKIGPKSSRFYIRVATTFKSKSNRVEST